ncbi:MAG TPA: peptide ABC transporter permease, partial [Gammaproteobacteria bacterium]|nr:peptide ABC transporter permease [Gammaproteobacteria bacterium]
MNFKHSYFYAVFWQRLKCNRLALAGGGVVVMLFLVSLLAGQIAPYDPNGINAWHVLEPPSWQHWFGTDELGRDVFS